MDEFLPAPKFYLSRRSVRLSAPSFRVHSRLPNEIVATPFLGASRGRLGCSAPLFSLQSHLLAKGVSAPLLCRRLGGIAFSTPSLEVGVINLLMPPATSFASFTTPGFIRGIDVEFRFTAPGLFRKRVLGLVVR